MRAAEFLGTDIPESRIGEFVEDARVIGRRFHLVLFAVLQDRGKLPASRHPAKLVRQFSLELAQSAGLQPRRREGACAKAKQ